MRWLIRSSSWWISLASWVELWNPGKGEGRELTPKVVLWLPHACHGMCIHTHVYRCTHTNNNKMRGATRKNQLDAVTNHAKMDSLDQSDVGVWVAHLGLNRLKDFTALTHSFTSPWPFSLHLYTTNHCSHSHQHTHSHTREDICGHIHSVTSRLKPRLELYTSHWPGVSPMACSGGWEIE